MTALARRSVLAVIKRLGEPVTLNKTTGGATDVTALFLDSYTSLLPGEVIDQDATEPRVILTKEDVVGLAYDDGVVLCDRVNDIALTSNYTVASIEHESAYVRVRLHEA